MSEKVVKRYQAKYVKTIDGDTVDLKFNLGFDIELVQRCRLMWVDTPEIHNTKHTSKEYIAGFAEKMYVAKWFMENGPTFTVDIYGKGYFLRWLAVVYPFNEGVSLNQELIDRGFYREGFTRTGRKFFSPLGEKIDINFPLGKFPLLGPESRRL